MSDDRQPENQINIQGETSEIHYLCRDAIEPEPWVDLEAWGSLRGRGKDAIVAMSEWGLSPRLATVGGSFVMSMSDWGLIPKVDVIPLQRFDHVRPVSLCFTRYFSRLPMFQRVVCDWGLIPKVDVIPLQRFDHIRPVSSCLHGVTLFYSRWLSHVHGFFCKDSLL